MSVQIITQPGLMKPPSIKNRLIRIQLAVAGLVMIFCFTSFLINDIAIFKLSIERSSESTAKVLERNLGPALMFKDRGEARKVLSSLEGEPSIIEAVIYDNTGEPFASYEKAATGTSSVSPALSLGDLQSIPQGTANPGYFVKRVGHHWLFFHNLILNNEKQGVLGLKIDLLTGVDVYKNHVWIALLVLMVCGIFSFVLASFMHRPLSEPIAQLAETAKAISLSGTYSIRTGELTKSQQTVEVMTLANEFSYMLDQIQFRDSQLKEANDALERKVEDRTEELRNAQKKALENAHSAGMAEIATDVLHNIGNITNSLNVSATELTKVVQNSKVSQLEKANKLLSENLDRLEQFFLESQGKSLALYYIKLGEVLALEQKQLVEEVAGIEKKLVLIKDVIHTQQEYAISGRNFEEISLQQFVDEILSMQSSSLKMHSIKIERRYLLDSMVRVQKVKLAHILVNLIKNAKDALEGLAVDNRLMIVEVGRSFPKGPYLKVIDNGSGIEKDKLDKIFSHGFTTKPSGHGFGLHFCANAMSEMGGRIEVESEGSGKGAQFSIQFPIVERSV